MTYSLRRRARMRSIRLAVHTDGSLVVSAGMSVPVAMIERLIEEKKEWIERHRARMRSRIFVAPRPSAEHYRMYKQSALELVNERVAHFAPFYHVQPKRLSIRNTKTRWGSCTKQGALTFSYRIIFLSPELRDYLVVHELCHLKEFNHSKPFWELVSLCVPDWQCLRRSLRLG